MSQNDSADLAKLFTCAGCVFVHKYRDRNDAAVVIFECRRHAPIIIPETQSLRGQFPGVDPDWRCGEWKPNPEFGTRRVVDAEQKSKMPESPIQAWVNAVLSHPNFNQDLKTLTGND